MVKIPSLLFFKWLKLITEIRLTYYPSNKKNPNEQLFFNGVSSQSTSHYFSTPQGNSMNNPFLFSVFLVVQNSQLLESIFGCSYSDSFSFSLLGTGKSYISEQHIFEFTVQSLSEQFENRKTTWDFFCDESQDGR